MKTTRVWVGTACLLTVLAGGTANAQDTRFVLANNTEFTVYSVYIWPVESSYMGSDRLGNAIIESGDTYQFVPDDGGCVYNIRVALAGSNYEKQWNRVNLCSLSRLTLNYSYLDQNLSASTQ